MPSWFIASSRTIHFYKQDAKITHSLHPADLAAQTKKFLRCEKAIWCSDPADDDPAWQTVTTRQHYINAC
jgi:hypothetical protein